jgi:hypothetical protein
LTTRRARTHSILHQSLNSFFLRDLGDERNPFCLLIATVMVGGERATQRWLDLGVALFRGGCSSALLTKVMSCAAPRGLCSLLDPTVVLEWL